MFIQLYSLLPKIGNCMENDNQYSKLISQYKNEIEEIIIESEHTYRLTIDYDILDMKVNDLLKCAVVDGLTEKNVWDLLQARIPSYVNYKNYKSSSKKVA